MTELMYYLLVLIIEIQKLHIKMNKMTKLNISLILLLISNIVLAQQDALFTQYTYNKLLVNPAYAGSKDGININLVNRTQWIGISGAPNTLTMSAHTAVKENKVGLGLNVYRDAIGPTVTNGIMGTYAYRLLSENAAISFGIQAGLLYYDFNYAAMNLKDQDYLFDPTNVRRFLPDFNVGFYYQTEKFFAGLSSKHLLENDYGFVKKENASSFERLAMHFYIMSGTILPLAEDIMFRPSTLIKFVKNTPVQFDINASVLFKTRFMIGASYRTEKAVALMTELEITEKVKLGLSYDFYFNELQSHNYGSAEIRLNFYINKATKDLASLNYF
jgi:type IX secretion system PorP/SprF family membrane protein